MFGEQHWPDTNQDIAATAEKAVSDALVAVDQALPQTLAGAVDRLKHNVDFGKDVAAVAEGHAQKITGLVPVPLPEPEPSKHTGTVAELHDLLAQVEHLLARAASALKAAVQAHG